MNRREEGFLLLTCRCKEVDRHCLTVRQLWDLEQLVLRSGRPVLDKVIELSDLTDIGCPPDMAQRVLQLLSQEDLMGRYREYGRHHGCLPITRIGNDYPSLLRSRLQQEAPGCIWYKGDYHLLRKPAVALVGSRELREESVQFAKRVGELAAYHGYVLISGNARGADTVAQESCLAAGGQVISIVADSLIDKRPRMGMVYVSEDGCDLPFTSARALSRNRLIHAMARSTFVAQCDYGKGGTWSGTTKNLRGRWSPVFCHYDGSNGAKALYDMGATMVSAVELDDVFYKIPGPNWRK